MADFNELPRGPEGTIYAKENGFDPGFKIEIDPTKIEFINKLKTSKASSIFHVNYHGKPRVLKVFHNNEDRGYADDGIRDLDRARCEIRAYCRLKRSGVCDGGYVPQFYGRDTGLPSAVLMEYLPNPLLMNSVTYSKERMAAAVKGIQQIHSALVDHNDSYPKNIMIVPGSPERVIWIDFDIAITYPDESYLTDWGRHRIEFETACVESYGVALAEDQKQGLPPNTKFY